MMYDVRIFARRQKPIPAYIIRHYFYTISEFPIEKILFWTAWKRTVFKKPFKFFYIKLRFITPTIFFVGIMSLINSFKVFREVYLLAGDYPVTSLYMLQHFMNNTFKSLDYQKLSSAAIIMAIVMTIIIGGLFLFENKVGKDVEG